ncbi:hypothetical protein FRC11_007186, partial [Ceratobasidium sp. 423]
MPETECTHDLSPWLSPVIIIAGQRSSHAHVRGQPQMLVIKHADDERLTPLPAYSINDAMTPNIITSPYGPLPPQPETNFIYALLHAPSPPRPPLPDDYVTHIDGITGEQRTFKQFVARINEVGAALLAPKDRGGLAIRPKEQ